MKRFEVWIDGIVVASFDDINAAVACGEERLDDDCIIDIWDHEAKDIVYRL